MKFTPSQVIEMAREAELIDARDDIGTIPGCYGAAITRLCTLAADRALEAAAHDADTSGIEGIDLHGDDVVAAWLRAMKEQA